MADEVIYKPTSPRRGLFLWMILSQVLTLAAIVWYVPLAFFLSGMLTDSGINGFEQTVLYIAMVMCLFSPATISIIIDAGAWMAYVRRRNILAAVLTGLPLLFALILYIWFVTTTF